MSLLTEKIGDWLGSCLQLDKADVAAIGPSRNAKAGDFTLPAFGPAKRLGSNPAEIAGQWATSLGNMDSLHPLVESVTATGPYLNLKLNPGKTAATLIDRILDEGDSWGTADTHKGKRVCIDFSSPNICKPFAIHHLRSTLIGAGIANLLESQGYDLERLNHLGDWGTQFGYVMLAWSKYHKGDDLGEHPLRTLVELYQRVSGEAKAAKEQGDESIHQEAAKWFRKLEEGDAEATHLWEWFRRVSIEELEPLYERMGIRFDAYRGEAHYQDVLDDTVRAVADAGVLVESEGAQVIDFGDDMPPFLLKKRDGATLYATRDIAALKDRWGRGDYALNLYVVAMQQNLHFKQLFAAMDQLKHPSSGRNVHISFGMLRMPDGTLGSTRKDNIIYLDEVLDTARDKARERLTDNIDTSSNLDIDILAEQIGLGAVYFNDLKAQRNKDVTFKWEDVLSFEGRTGAYLQYAQARMNSILSKGNWTGGAHDSTRLEHVREKDLLLMLDRYPSVLADAATKFEPNHLVNYLFDMVQTYSSLTQDKEGGVKVLCDNTDLRAARLALVAATRQTLLNGLKLLCLPCPEQM